MKHSDLATGPRNSVLISCFIVVFALSGMPPILGSTQAAPSRGASSTAFSYASHGHVLNFGADRIVVSNGQYALQIAFQDANSVVPASQGASAAEAGQLAPLGHVTYSDLWDGITLAYQASGSGIFESTYVVAPHANAAAIRLRYNAPVTLNADGSLATSFANGRLVESAPVAWQEKGAQKLPVPVSFEQSAGDEVSFALGAYDPDLELYIDPTLVWNTFLGGSGDDEGTGIALDGSGNVYVMGESNATWGSPLRAFTGSFDVFVAKLDASGSLKWSTFLGGAGTDLGRGLTVSPTGNVYVGGYSGASWGSPKRAYTGSWDGFAAGLSSNGILVWNTFLGGSGTDFGQRIAIDSSENVFLVGSSDASWGTPLRAYSALDDTFVVKLSSSGVFQWNTFLGDVSQDDPNGITTDGAGSIYITGASEGTWGSPLHGFKGGWDVYVGKLNSDGSLAWNTFLGGTSSDTGIEIAVDGLGNVFVMGSSLGDWDASLGTSVRPFWPGSSQNVFVARLSSLGTLAWHTFLGGPEATDGWDFTLDNTGYVYAAGFSGGAWGCPTPAQPAVPLCTVRAFQGSRDIFGARLDAASGKLMWNTFLGGAGDDAGGAVAVYPSGDVYIAGSSNDSWGSPIVGYSSSSYDAVVAKLDSGVHQISGNTGAPGATLTYTDGIAKTAQSLADGSYSLPVSYNWSGTVVPILAGFSILPANIAYANIVGDLPGQNYGAFSPVGRLANKLKPTLTWTNVGATKYRLQLYQGTALIFAKVVKPGACGPLTCSSKVGVPLTYSPYRWRLQALFANGTRRTYGPFKFKIVLQPKPGFWKGNGGDVSFYVTPDSSAITQFKVIFVGPGACTNQQINLSSVPITNHQFSFGGHFHANGTFITGGSISGTAGYTSSTCNIGALPWTATWQNGLQP